MNHEDLKSTPLDQFLQNAVFFGPELFRDADLLPMHERNVRGRLCVFAALKDAVNPVLTHYLNPQENQCVLEVGCGTGFLQKYLAPSWLSEKIVGFDINRLSLSKVRQTTEQNYQLFQGNVYQLPLSKDCLDAVIGYSSFDSLGNLPQAINQAAVCLKPHGHLLLFQDLCTGFYGTPSNAPRNQSVEIYHKHLVDSVRANGSLDIIAGETACLEGLAVEPVEELRKRIGGLTEEIGSAPLFLWDRGEAAEFKKIGKDVRKWHADVHYQRSVLHPQKDFTQISAEPDQAIEWVRLRYLIAQKTA